MLPIPDGPLTVGMDGSCVTAQGMEQDGFEVMAGKVSCRSAAV